jgi:hypothetical protein
MLNRDERARLLAQPFPVVRYHPSHYPWAGRLIGDKDGQTSKRVHGPLIDDESWYYVKEQE